MNTELDQYLLGEKKIWMSMCQQVFADVIMRSCYIFEKHTSQNAMNMKLGR